MRRPPTRRPGFSIVELLVVLTILGAVLAIVSRTAVRMQRDYVRQRAIAQAEATARAAETAIVLAFGGALANPFGITTVGASPRIDSIATGLRLVGDFNPPDADVADELENVAITVASKELRMQWQVPATTAPVVVATPVDSVSFQFFAADSTRVGAPAGTGTYPTTVRAVRLVIYVPTSVTTAPTFTRERWLYLRNRP